MPVPTQFLPDPIQLYLSCLASNHTWEGHNHEENEFVLRGFLDYQAYRSALAAENFQVNIADDPAFDIPEFDVDEEVIYINEDEDVDR
jgi:hypothetical protein